MPGIVALNGQRVLIPFYSFDPNLPYDYRREKDPEPWAEVWYFWNRYIACVVLRER